MVMKKICVFTLFIISILFMIIGIRLLLTEQIALNVNSKNRDEIRKLIGNNEEKNIDIDKVYKITLGKGWHSGEINVYYLLGKKEKIFQLVMN